MQNYSSGPDDNANQDGADEDEYENRGFDSGGNQTDDFDDYGMEDFSQPSNQKQQPQPLLQQKMAQ